MRFILSSLRFAERKITGTCPYSVYCVLINSGEIEIILQTQIQCCCWCCNYIAILTRQKNHKTKKTVQLRQSAHLLSLLQNHGSSRSTWLRYMECAPASRDSLSMPWTPPSSTNTLLQSANKNKRLHLHVLCLLVRMTWVDVEQILCENSWLRQTFCARPINCLHLNDHTPAAPRTISCALTHTTPAPTWN